MIKTNIFYPRFSIVSKSPFFKTYLKWAYSQGIKDLHKMNFLPNFSKKNFTCLLCGCASEITAEIFIDFTLNKNQEAKIIILDIGKEQTDVVKSLVSAKYSKKNISVLRADILTFDSFRPSSVDWIESDAVLGYFDEDNLTKVLKKWNCWLTNDGFITIREAGFSDPFSYLIDSIKRWGAKMFFGSLLYRRSKKELEDALTKAGFLFVSGSTPIPSLLRYSMIKK